MPIRKCTAADLDAAFAIIDEAAQAYRGKGAVNFAIDAGDSPYKESHFADAVASIKLE